MEEKQRVLHIHKKHPHVPRNVNDVHKAEQRGFNTRIAVILTNAVGTMWCAYIFFLLSIVGLFGLLGWLNPFTFLLATWVSQQCLQLIFLPILSVGQNVLNRKSELMAQEQFDTTQHSFHDIEEIAQHLSAQDMVLLQHTKTLEEQMKLLTRLVESGAVSSGKKTASKQ